MEAIFKILPNRELRLRITLVADSAADCVRRSRMGLVMIMSTRVRSRYYLGPLELGVRWMGSDLSRGVDEMARNLGARQRVPLGRLGLDARPPAWRKRHKLELYTDSEAHE